MNLSAFNQPFPYECGTSYKVKMAVFFGGFIFIFLLVFKPFDLDQFNSQRLLFISGVYGLITFGCVFICSTLMPLFLPQVFTEKSWTTGKQIVFAAFIMFIVGLVNYLVSPLLVDTELTVRDAIWFQGITLSIGLIPVSLFVISRQNKLSKKFRGEADIIEKELQEKLIAEEPGDENQQSTSNKIILVGDYQNEKLELNADDLHFVTSASNYIKIFHSQKGKLVYSIIRLTLKKSEEILLAYPNFFKCHRAYIINLDKVTHVEGNAQGYRVNMQGHDEPVPVSRNLSKEFSDKLLAFKNRISYNS